MKKIGAYFSRQRYQRRIEHVRYQWPPAPHFNSGERSYSRVVESMIATGWCPHHVHYLAQKFDEETLQFLSQVSRSPSRLSGHESCATESWCVAHNVKLNSYVVKHVEEGCQCGMISVDYERLVEIIGRGEVPLVSFNSTEARGGEEISLQLVEKKSSSKYTAISHVWADGLGNPQANAFPICQLKALYKRLKKLHAPALVS